VRGGGGKISCQAPNLNESKITQDATSFYFVAPYFDGLSGGGGKMSGAEPQQVEDNTRRDEVETGFHFVAS
jgi:hypothetical protein